MQHNTMPALAIAVENREFVKTPELAEQLKIGGLKWILVCQ